MHARACAHAPDVKRRESSQLTLHCASVQTFFFPYAPLPLRRPILRFVGLRFLAGCQPDPTRQTRSAVACNSFLSPAHPPTHSPPDNVYTYRYPDVGIYISSARGYIFAPVRLFCDFGALFAKVT